MKEKHAGGRPPKYKTAKEMQKVIDKYFESCFRPVRIFVKEFNKYMTLTDDKGEIMKEQYRPFTITGLADSLDMSRETLLRYGENDEFSDTIMRAKRKCEVYAEERLYDKEGANGAKFSLSNNFSNWKEKQDINANVNTEIKVTLTDD